LSVGFITAPCVFLGIEIGAMRKDSCAPIEELPPFQLYFNLGLSALIAAKCLNIHMAAINPKRAKK
jgi:hypothetical protein